jgi:hypothetical protein
MSGGAQPDRGGDPVLSRSLADALADELVRLTTQLGDLAYDLGGDPHTLRRHMEALQAIDLVTQTQLAIADMLRSGEPVEERVAAITLADMAGRLRTALAA